ncbi:MAG TPA: cobalamin-independent methionine synthase II family protein [Dehalococcoidia bacterium]|nr:cobalamin-independent methionine synthase II family protein [Dehalococcoidia bacterium]
MKRSTDRYLTTHVGSMIRPQEIQDYYTAVQNVQPADAAAHEARLRTEVAKVVRKQAECGIDVVSDGEFGKPSWLHILTRISGFETREIERPKVGFRGWDPEERFKDFYDQSSFGRLPTRQNVCVGPITYTDEGRRVMKRDVDNLKAALQGVKVEEAFLPVIAPCSISVNYKNEYYKDDEEFLFAVADALHEEYKIIVDAGFLVQTDDAILANLHDPVVDAGIDYRSWVDMNLRALNHALRGIPEDRVRYHLCWGSWPGPHTTDVPLAEIVDLILKVNCQAYSIEAANPRHEWEWVVWQDTKLPDGKILLPGMISHAITHVEHPELVAQRIKRYADLVGPENVIASSDCGFAQGTTTARQEREVVWAKLEALAEGARLATQRRK